MDEEVGIRLNLKGRREAAAGLDDVGDKLDRAGDEAVALGRKSRIGAAGVLSLGKTGRLAGRAMVYGFGAATAAVVGAGIVLTKLSKDSIAEAREAQKVGAITRREIHATGAVANVTARQVGNLTGAISEKVGVDDEEIQSGANLILTFKNVRNEVGKGSKIFNRATRDAVDLAKGGFGSITSQSKMLAKALNDPIKGLSAMSRSGVTFSEQQTKRIEDYVEEGKLLGAQKIILGEVESQVGGVAEAQATWGEKATVSIGNIKEQLGTALLPALDGVEKWFVTKGTPVISGWIDVFERRGIPIIERYVGVFRDKGIPAIGNFLDDARPLAESVLPAIGTALGTTRDVVKDLAPKLKSIFDGFNNLPDWAKQAIVIGAGGAAVASKLGAGKLITGGVGSVISKAKPLPVWVVNGGTGVPGLTTPGSPTGPGGGGIPPVVPATAGGKLMSLLRSPLGLGSILTGVTLADRHPEGGWGTPEPDKWVSMDEYQKMLDQNSTRQREALAELMGGYSLVSHGAKKAGDSATAMADLTVDAYGTTYKALTPIIGGLNDITKPRTATVHLDGVDTAMARLDAFRSKLDALNGMTAGGAPLPNPPGSAPDQLIDDLTGGRHHHQRPGGTRVPRLRGVSHPRVPKLVSGDSYAGGHARATITVPVYLDGKVIMESTVDHLETQAARK